jgi:hypothetical protein
MFVVKCLFGCMYELIMGCLNVIIAGDSVWGEMSVLLHVWIKSGFLNGIITGDVCDKVSVLLHVWINYFCLNYIIAGDSVWGETSVLLHVWIKSGCLNGIITGDVCGKMSVLLHVWINYGCLNDIIAGDSAWGEKSFVALNPVVWME